jgi:hypothetical protein
MKEVIGREKRFSFLQGMYSGGKTRRVKRKQLSRYRFTIGFNSLQSHLPTPRPASPSRAARKVKF